MDGGGSERQLLYLLQRIDRERFEPILYLLYETGSLLTEVPPDVRRIAFWTETTFPRWNWPGRIHRMQVNHLANALRREQIDVTYDRLFHMTLITGPASRIQHVPRVSTIVSPPQFDLARSEKRWLTWKKYCLKRAYETANSLLTVGTGTADNAASYYRIPRERFEVMLSPIDIDRIDQDSQSDLDDFGLRSGRKNIISIGRLSDEKGHRYLLQAFAKYCQHVSIDRLPPADLHIVGDGVLRKELQSLTANLGIEDSVRFHGQVSNPFPLLKQCDLLCLPSLYEGMPNALLEAMACRVPVLATNTAQGAGELLRMHPLGTLVPKANVNEMANAIQDRFINPSAWLERTEPAREYVETHHCLQDWVEKVSTVLANVAKKP